jgi:hypothetical protein
MAPMLKPQPDNPHCSSCGDEMELTVIIPPFGSPYGLRFLSVLRADAHKTFSLGRPRRRPNGTVAGQNAFNSQGEMGDSTDVPH